MKRFIADIALVRLLSTVGQSVVLVVALLMETLATELTLERLVPVVNPHVSVQSGAPVERLSTNLTLVRLLIGVDDLVTTESGRLSEAFATDLALRLSIDVFNLKRVNLANKRPSSRVHGHVSCQVVMCVEDFSTVWTRVGLVLALHHLKDQNHSLFAIGHFDLFDLNTHWLNFGVQGEANSCSSSSCRDPSIWRPIP